MEKFSVKKPFTVLVAVIMVLMLGFVSITKMKTNLLPNVSTPYLMVVTVYPGASPERVETEVSDVLQNALTVPGVSKITATSAENYSLLLMQFVDDTDMDSALVQVSNKLDQAKSDLPETALTPSVIQYSMNMNAFMTVAVSREGSSVYDLSDFIKNTMTPYVQRKGGVSSVSSSGLVEQLVQVQLNQEKVDAINEKLMGLSTLSWKWRTHSWRRPRPRSRPAAQNTISSSKTSAIPCPTRSWAPSAPRSAKP